MADLTNPLSPITITLGMTGHDSIHTEDRDLLEKIRAYIEQQIDVADVTGTKAMTWAAGTVKDYRLTGNTTFVFPTDNIPVGGGGGLVASMSMRLRQDGTGNRTVTWPAATVLRWAGGAVPTLSSAANRVDWLTFVSVDTGVTWYGFVAGKDMR